MRKKITSLFVITAFFVSNVSFALSPQPGSNIPVVRKEMYALGQKKFGINRGDGALILPEYEHPRRLHKQEPQDIPGVDFVRADYKRRPESWEKNAIFLKTDLIEALKYFRNVEARIPPGELDIQVGYFPVNEEEGEFPISRIEPHKDGKHVLVVHPKFLEWWNHIRENDVWYTRRFPDGSERTISLAWGIFHRVAKHEMMDLEISKTGRKSSSKHEEEPHLAPKGGGHYSSLFPTEEEEIEASKIGGNYKYDNDKIWLWFLTSYLLANTTRYDNVKLAQRIKWIFGPEKSDGEKLDEEFPNLKDDMTRWQEAIRFACRLNHEFFLRDGEYVEVPDLLHDKKFKDFRESLETLKTDYYNERRHKIAKDRHIFSATGEGKDQLEPAKLLGFIEEAFPDEPSEALKKVVINAVREASPDVKYDFLKTMLRKAALRPDYREILLKATPLALKTMNAKIEEAGLEELSTRDVPAVLAGALSVLSRLEYMLSQEEWEEFGALREYLQEEEKRLQSLVFEKLMLRVVNESGRKDGLLDIEKGDIISIYEEDSQSKVYLCVWVDPLGEVECVALDRAGLFELVTEDRNKFIGADVYRFLGAASDTEILEATARARELAKEKTILVEEAVICAIDALREEEYMVEGIPAKEITERLGSPEAASVQLILDQMVRQGRLASFTVSIEQDEKMRREWNEIIRREQAGEITTKESEELSEDLYRRNGAARFVLSPDEIQKRQFQEERAEEIVASPGKVRKLAAAMYLLFNDRLNSTLYPALQTCLWAFKDREKIEKVADEISKKTHKTRQDDLNSEIGRVYWDKNADELDADLARQFIAYVGGQMRGMLPLLEELTELTDVEEVREKYDIHNKLKTSYAHLYFVCDFYGALGDAVQKQMDEEILRKTNGQLIQAAETALTYLRTYSLKYSITAEPGEAAVIIEIENPQVEKGVLKLGIILTDGEPAPYMVAYEYGEGDKHIKSGKFHTTFHGEFPDLTKGVLELCINTWFKGMIEPDASLHAGGKKRFGAKGPGIRSAQEIEIPLNEPEEKSTWQKFLRWLPFSSKGSLKDTTGAIETVELPEGALEDALILFGVKHLVFFERSGFTDGQHEESSESFGLATTLQTRERVRDVLVDMGCLRQKKGKDRWFLTPKGERVVYEIASARIFIVNALKSGEDASMEEAQKQINAIENPIVLESLLEYFIMYVAGDLTGEPDNETLSRNAVIIKAINERIEDLTKKPPSFTGTYQVAAEREYIPEDIKVPLDLARALLELERLEESLNEIEIEIIETGLEGFAGKIDQMRQKERTLQKEIHAALNTPEEFRPVISCQSLRRGDILVRSVDEEGADIKFFICAGFDPWSMKGVFLQNRGNFKAAGEVKPSVAKSMYLLRIENPSAASETVKLTKRAGGLLEEKRDLLRQAEAIAEFNKEQEFTRTFIARIASRAGPGTPSDVGFKEEDQRATFEAVNLLHETSIEILVPQTELEKFELTHDMKKAIKLMQRRGLSIEVTTYNARSLSNHLSERPDGVKRIIISNSWTSRAISGLLNDKSSVELFRDVRLLNLEFPANMKSSGEKTLWQARFLMVTILARLLEDGAGDAIVVKALLLEMLGESFHLDKDAAGKFIDALSVSEENSSGEDIKKRVQYFLDNVVRWTEMLAREYRLMQEFWTYA